ncbi:hypothetical protein K439DRAFT_68222 [Ramaria rubella]|nr:hypothetical protein K439DRAFT_68222 [Ramaria rubella]
MEGVSDVMGDGWVGPVGVGMMRGGWMGACMCVYFLWGCSVAGRAWSSEEGGAAV